MATQKELLNEIIELHSQIWSAKKHLDTLKGYLMHANEEFAKTWKDCDSPFVYDDYLVDVKEEWWDYKDKLEIVTVKQVEQFENLITK